MVYSANRAHVRAITERNNKAEFPTPDREAILKGEALRRSANERVDRISLSEGKGFLDLTLSNASCIVRRPVKPPKWLFLQDRTRELGSKGLVTGRDDGGGLKRGGGRGAEGNYVRDCMPGNEFRYLLAQWNSFVQPSMSDYCVDSYHYCLINEYRSSPVEYIKLERDIKTLGFFTYYTVAMGEVNPSGPVPIDSVFIYRPDKRLELWRFAFYMFLHAGWLHLLFNLGVQVVVGLPLEMVHGSLRIAAVYMAGVLAASYNERFTIYLQFFSEEWIRLRVKAPSSLSSSLLSSSSPSSRRCRVDCVTLAIIRRLIAAGCRAGRYMDRATRCNHKSSLGTSVFDTDVYLVGASGGVYALLAAHLANVLLNYNNMEFGIVRLIGIFVIASADVGFAIYDRYAAEQMGPPVSYVAHLTGALAGLTIGLLVLKNFEQRLHEQLLWWVALGVYAACTIFAIMYNLMHPDYP
ncbi:Protein rhomboid [Trachymyrmex zeteki]|uniref:Protein rhomboid n=1 Tax=Mycetomoellerius zeteki TaxID=64791 RepID=A0A151WTI6_9HYME|nr:Protein rhomboid [Trachymyrmex zeteki]